MTALFKRIDTWALILFALLLGTTGLEWGLPSQQRAELLFQQKTIPAPYLSQLVHNRRRLHKIREGAEPTPLEYQSGLRKNLGLLASTADGKTFGCTDNYLPFPLSLAYSSYLVRATDGDEPKVLTHLSQIKPAEGIFLPPVTYYGTIYYYTLGAFIKLMGFLKQAVLIPDISHYYQHPEDMASVYKAGRLHSFFFGFLTFLLGFILAHKWGGPKAAIWTGLFWTTSNLTIYLGHVIKPHMMATFFALLTFYFATRVISASSIQTRFYVWGGIFNGLALACTLNVAPFALSIPLAHLMRLNRREYLGKTSVKNISILILISVAIFLIGYPKIIFEFKDWWASLKLMTGEHPATWNVILWGPTFFKTMGASMRTPIFLLSLAGFIFSIKNNV